ILPLETGAKFDLTLYVEEHGGGLHLKWVYNADLFAPARVAEMAEQYRALLEQAVAEPESAVSALSLVTASARRVLPDPAEPLSAAWRGSVTEIFHAWTLRSPGSVAVADRQGEWTYGELDAWSNRLAGCLGAGGVRPGDVVAIYGHRSAPLVWALLGIFKTG